MAHFCRGQDPEYRVEERKEGCELDECPRGRHIDAAGGHGLSPCPRQAAIPVRTRNSHNAVATCLDADTLVRCPPHTPQLSTRAYQAENQLSRSQGGTVAKSTSSYPRGRRSERARELPARMPHILRATLPFDWSLLKERAYRMQVANFYGNYDLRVEEVPIPQPKADQVQIKVAW